jgi:hypothetical protein
MRGRYGHACPSRWVYCSRERLNKYIGAGDFTCNDDVRSTAGDSASAPLPIDDTGCIGDGPQTITLRGFLGGLLFVAVMGCIVTVAIWLLWTGGGFISSMTVFCIFLVGVGRLLLLRFLKTLTRYPRIPE